MTGRIAVGGSFAGITVGILSIFCSVCVGLRGDSFMQPVTIRPNKAARAACKKDSEIFGNLAFKSEI